MSRFFYTFGSSKQFPYCNGWVEVIADSQEEAHKKFRSWFPDVNHNTLNCSDYYTWEQWNKISKSAGNDSYKCYEIIEQFKFKIAVQEILQKIVEVKADSLTEAECLVQTAYDNEKIVLCAEDLVTNPISGNRCNIFEANCCECGDVLEKGEKIMRIDNGNLMSCPFCGNKNIVVVTCHDLEDCENFGSCEDTGYYTVVCNRNNGGCGASSGYKATIKAAVEAWNRRQN